MLHNKCSVKIRKLLMIVFLLLTYIYIGYFNKALSILSNTSFIPKKCNLKTLNLINFHFITKLPFIKRTFNYVGPSLSKKTGINKKSFIDENKKYCSYLQALLKPWDLPENCIVYTDNENQNRSDFLNNSDLVKNEVKYNNVNEIQRVRFQNNINAIKKLRNNFKILKMGESNNDHVEYNNINNQINDDNIYKRLAQVSLNIKYNDTYCDENIDFNKLWDFGRVLCKVNGEISSNCDNSKYYFDFLALVYYSCIFNSDKRMLIDKVNINDQLLFETAECYQSIPIFEIEDDEIVLLSKLCKWKYKKYKISNKYNINIDEMKLITKFIRNVNHLFLNIDLININIKYNYGLVDNKFSDNNNMTVNDIDEDKIPQTEYFNKLLKLVKVIYNQLLIQYDNTFEEINMFIKFTNKTNQNGNNSLIAINNSNEFKILSDSESGSIGISDSFNWKQLIDSIFYNSQNILIREHINAMLINIVFDTLVQIFNPWISLFYQASFIVNSYLSIITFLLIIAIILVCFNTIPCFRNEKHSKKTDILWKKVLRIYKTNTMVVLLNLIFMLGGLLRYLYLPNEMELSNPNIEIIKTMNKILNIILCPFVINIITSFSTIFSIFQWQLIWITSKLSLSSIINLNGRSGL